MTSTNPSPDAASAPSIKESGAAGANPAYDVSIEKAFLDALKEVPWIGPWLVVVFRKWKLQGLLLLLVGLLTGGVIVGCLFVFSIMPAWSVPDKYRVKDKSNEPRVTPHGRLEIAEVADENKLQNWLKDYRLFFRDAAADWSDPNVVARTAIVMLKSPLANDTNEFPWLLELRPGYSLQTIRGFRVTKSGMIQPLQNSDGVPTHFLVPPCDREDTLIALVLATQPKGSRDDSLLFQSYAP